MAAPDDAVAGSDHVDLAPFERLERLLNMARVRHDDVGVVFLRLRQHLGQAHLVVEVLRRREMLAERVVGEQDAVVFGIRGHIVGPVHHHGLSEGKRSLADAQGIARLDRHVAAVAVMGGQTVHTVRTAGVNFRTRSEVGNGRNRAGVILLYVVDDDVLDTGRIDHLADTLDKFAGESRFAGIDKGHLLVHDKVGVVRGTAIRRVSVEVTLVPIDAAHPVHVGLHLHRMQHGRSYRSPPLPRRGGALVSRLKCYHMESNCRELPLLHRHLDLGEPLRFGNAAP